MPDYWDGHGCGYAASLVDSVPIMGEDTQMSNILEPPYDPPHYVQVPYIYTPLCPDPGLRQAPELARRHGIRPISVSRKCLCCGKVWPAGTGRRYCDCDRQGYLYGVAEYYQIRTGGVTDGQGDTGPVLRNERRD